MRRTGALRFDADSSGDAKNGPSFPRDSGAREVAAPWEKHRAATLRGWFCPVPAGIVAGNAPYVRSLSARFIRHFVNDL